MADSVFISYSRKDQEYVPKLAEDLNQRVSGSQFSCFGAVTIALIDDKGWQ